MFESPVHDAVEDRQQIFAHFSQRILHMLRDLVEDKDMA